MPRYSLKAPAVELRRRKFVREFVKNGNATEAVTRAYPNMKRTTARSYAKTMLDREDVQKDLKQVMLEQGLTMDSLLGDTKELLSKGKVDLEDSKITPELYSKTLFKLIDLHMDDRLSSKTTLNINVDYATTPQLLEQRSKYIKFFNSIVDGEIVGQDTQPQSAPPTHPKTENKK